MAPFYSGPPGKGSGKARVGGSQIVRVEHVPYRLRSGVSE